MAESTSRAGPRHASSQVDPQLPSASSREGRRWHRASSQGGPQSRRVSSPAGQPARRASAHASTRRAAVALTMGVAATSAATVQRTAITRIFTDGAGEGERCGGGGCDGRGREVDGADPASAAGALYRKPAAACSCASRRHPANRDASLSDVPERTRGAVPRADVDVDDHPRHRG